MKQKIIPIISVIIGIIAFLLTQQYIRSKEAELDALVEEFKRKTAPVLVVAAKTALPRGSTIAMDDLKPVQIGQALKPERAIDWKERFTLEKKKTEYEIDAGNMILWSDIEGGDPSAPSLAPMIKPGMRAISLNISGAAGVSGMIEPADRVDVLGTFTMSSKAVAGEMETVTLTVLQDVTVLATGQTLAKDRFYHARRGRQSGGYSTVTLEVTAREAEVLVFAQQMRGSLALSLRNPSDQSFERNLPDVNFQHIEKNLPDLNLFRQQTIRHKQGITR